MRRNPGWDYAEDDSGEQREQQRESENHWRRAGLDGHLRRIRESKGEDGARTEISDGNADHSSDNRENDAFGQHLADQDGTSGAESRTDGSLCTTRRPASEQKVRDVGAGHEQNQRRNPDEQAQTVSGFLLKILNASTAGGKHDVLLGNLLIVAISGIGGLCGKPLAKTRSNFAFERLGSDSRLHAAQNIEPVRFGHLQVTGFALEDRLVIQGNPKRGRAVVDAVAKESGRSNAHDGHRMTLDEERGADHVAVSGVRRLPGCIADDGNRRGTGHIVGGLEHAPGIGADAESGKVVSRNIFSAFGFRHGVADAHIHQVLAGLKSGKLFKFGSGVLKMAV